MLPSRKDVRDLLEARTGCPVRLTPAVPYAPSAYERAAFAVYVDQQMRTRAVVTCDLTMATLTGAAMGRFPAGRAEEERRGGTLTAAVRRQLEDLLVDFASVLRPTDGRSLRWYSTYLPGAEIPTDVPAYAHVMGQRLDLRVSLSGYGTGRMSVVCPPVIPAPRQPDWSLRPAAVG
jgi:hypothetical protein